MFVLITGANGMLGSHLVKKMFKEKIRFIHADAITLDIYNQKRVELFIQDLKITHIVNCAAYTDVNKANINTDLCEKINAEAVRKLAMACEKYNVGLMHFSTDYVFDGTNKIYYSEHDVPNPINFYGQSKLKGENFIKECCTNYKIIRLQWLYGNKGNNFINKILKKYAETGEVSVVEDEFGSPSSTEFVSNYIIKILKNWNDISTGVYHLAHDNYCSWYEFASFIFKSLRIENRVNPISKFNFSSNVDRPTKAVLSNDKLKNTLRIKSMGTWQDDFKEFIQNNKEFFI